MKVIDNENFLDKAEKAIESLKNQKDNWGKPVGKITTSQIRNILSMTADIYNEVMLLDGNDLGEHVKSKIAYLRVRCLYEAGRSESVRAFVTESQLLEILPSIGDRKEYLLFSQYMEALVAWHKYLGGRDN